MAVTLINLTGHTWGVTAEETGINVREFKVTVEPEFIEHLPGKTNLVRGSAIGDMKKTIDISGEINDTDGIMAATAITNYAASNSSAFFGAPTSALLLTRAEVTSTRDGWQDLSASFEAYAGRTIGA